jgi:hypothetical protein
MRLLTSLENSAFKVNKPTIKPMYVDPPISAKYPGSSGSSIEKLLEKIKLLQHKIQKADENKGRRDIAAKVGVLR